MFKNYFKTAWRNLIKNKANSFINIAGLSVGMAVAILIGLWIWSELSFDKNFDNYNSIAQVMQTETLNGEVNTNKGNVIPLAAELRKSYGSDFKNVVLSSWSMNSMLASGDKKINFCSSRFWRIADHVVNGELSIDQISNSQPGEKFEKGMIN